MDRERIEEIFAPVARVAVRRMFGGHGVYADELFFALESGGDIYLEVDAATQSQFEAAGSSPFVYEKKAGKAIALSYWRLVEAAYDDEDELRRWVALALQSALRAQAESAKKASRRRARPTEQDGFSNEP